MEPSSTQNPPDSEISSHAQNSLHDEDISKSLSPKNSEETAESSNTVQKADVPENNINSTKETHISTSNEECSVNNTENEKISGSVAEELSNNIQNRRVLMVFGTHNRLRHQLFHPSFFTPTLDSRFSPGFGPGFGPVFGPGFGPGFGPAPGQRVPPPPAYYQMHTPNTNTATQSSQSTTREFLRNEAYLPLHFYHMGLFSDMGGAVSWAQYPNTIPSGVPPGLAHLVDAEVLFIIQKIDYLLLSANISDLNMFLILNKNGEYLYYAYETTTIWGELCCRSSRNFQMHIVDIYQNEVIYLNKPYGCTHFCCCYPMIEIYAPPMTPVGAITKVFNPCQEEFIVVDADENEIFRIFGSNVLAHCCYGGLDDFVFTIHALDSQKTVVGFIKREPGGFVRAIFTDADIYGISFPKNMDARMKAVFLGALFLISLKRTGWVLRNVEDPETVSGHMYRMSIMTFLIPESSGVDKTRCMKLSLVHDLAECIVGDLTPYCGVDTSEKHRQEEVAMKELTQMIGDSGVEIYKLYKEYEAQVTEESKFVKDLDRLDMILQAFEYEKLGEKPGKLEEFFASTINKFHFPWTIDIVREIYKQRNLHINKDKSLGKAAKKF